MNHCAQLLAQPTLDPSLPENPPPFGTFRSMKIVLPVFVNPELVDGTGLRRYVPLQNSS